MNLIIATRVDEQHVRFDVDGKWRYGDALNLAYQIKAGVTRTGRNQVLVDLRRVFTPSDVEGRFLICHRLRRAMSTAVRIALVSPANLVDADNLPDALQEGVDISCFELECAALGWLHGGPGRST